MRLTDEIESEGARARDECECHDAAATAERIAALGPEHVERCLQLLRVVVDGQCHERRAQSEDQQEHYLERIGKGHRPETAREHERHHDGHGRDRQRRRVEAEAHRHHLRCSAQHRCDLDQHRQREDQRCGACYQWL
jgi:hypothetical protein